MLNSCNFIIKYIPYLFLLIIFSYFPIELKSNNSEKSKEALSSLSKVNQYLERLEQSLKTNRYKESCVQSRETIRIIKLNSTELTKIEPHYHWEEIKDLLIKISLDSCNK